MEIPGVASIGGSINAGGINDVAGGAGSIGDRHGVTRSDAARKSTLNSASAAASISAVLRSSRVEVALLEPLFISLCAAEPGGGRTPFPGMPRVPRSFIEGAGVAGGMMGRAELGGAIAEALATAVREMLSRHAIAT